MFLDTAPPGTDRTAPLRCRFVVTLSAAAIALAVLPTVAIAADLKDMIGTWRWKQFVIQVTECESHNVCAKVVEGPKNVGMQVFATNLVPKDGNLVGQIAHPESKEIYSTRFQQDGPDAWRLDGCTAARVCLSGEFARVK
jgi:hypothetical protein